MTLSTPYTDEVFGLSHSPDFVRMMRATEEVGFSDFLSRLKVSEALKIASATTEEERTKVHVRVLLIDELSNFTKSLLSIDKDA